MNAIAAVSADWGIGYRNDLLFSIPEDMKYFRRMTKGGTVILGRRNLESFPGGRPLPNRRHLLLTKDPTFAAEGVEIYHSVEEVLAVVKDIPEDDVWVIGGGQIYGLFLPYCRKAYITHIDSTVPAEVFFPDLEKEDGWVLAEAGEEQSYGDLTYRFSVYENRKCLL